jgi:fatty acid synthase subunit alpha
MMGFIKYHNGLLEGKDYSGWVDTEKNTPVGDYEVKEKFEDRILSHAGGLFKGVPAIGILCLVKGFG